MVTSSRLATYEILKSRNIHLNPFTEVVKLNNTKLRESNISNDLHQIFDKKIMQFLDYEASSKNIRSKNTINDKTLAFDHSKQILFNKINFSDINYAINSSENQKSEISEKQEINQTTIATVNYQSSLIPNIGMITSDVKVLPDKLTNQTDIRMDIPSQSLDSLSESVLGNHASKMSNQPDLQVNIQSQSIKMSNQTYLPMDIPLQPIKMSNQTDVQVDITSQSIKISNLTDLQVDIPSQSIKISNQTDLQVDIPSQSIDSSPESVHGKHASNSTAKWTMVSNEMFLLLHNLTAYFSYEVTVSLYIMFFYIYKDLKKILSTSKRDDDPCPP